MRISPAIHVERHMRGGAVVRDAVLGMSDGLTVPFALAAGVAGATASGSIVVIAGLAEVAAGSIAMGLGAYLAARTDAEHYERELEREQREVRDMPDREEAEVVHILRRYGANPNETRAFVRALERKPANWVDFMMRFELGLERPAPFRARVSALTIGLSYAAGGIIPLFPYFLVRDITAALVVSAAVTAVALVVFGYAKGRAIGAAAWTSALQTLLVGGLAAGVAFALARLIS